MLNHRWHMLISKSHPQFSPLMKQYVYRFLAKVLSILQKVLPRIFTQAQAAFVQGHQMLDSVLIANECLHSRHKDAIPGLICKLDIRKAYDSRFGYLAIHVTAYGFGSKSQDWIWECVLLASFSILINGTPKDFFFLGSRRGIRKGDLCPLSSSY